MNRENPSETQNICLNERTSVSTAEIVRERLRLDVRRLAMPGEPGEGVKAALNRVARRAGIPASEAKRLWYSEWRRIPADIAERVDDAVTKHERRLDAELATLRARYYALNNHSSDPEFYAARTAQCTPPADDMG